MGLEYFKLHNAVGIIFLLNNTSTDNELSIPLRLNNGIGDPSPFTYSKVQLHNSPLFVFPTLQDLSVNTKSYSFHVKKQGHKTPTLNPPLLPAATNPFFCSPCSKTSKQRSVSFLAFSLERFGPHHATETAMMKTLTTSTLLKTNSQFSAL